MGKNRFYCEAAERSVMGYLLMYPEKFESIKSGLDPEMFIDPDNKNVIKKMFAAYKKGLNTAYQFISSDGSCPNDYEGRFDEVLCIEEIVHKSIKQLRDLYSRRLAIAEHEKHLDLLKNSDNPTKDIIVGSTNKISKTWLGDGDTESSENIIQMMEEDKKNNRDRTLFSIKTGLYQLDDISLAFNGIPAGNVTVIAGDTGQGKSAFAQTISANAAANGIPVIYASMEDRREALINRRISQFSGIPNRRVQQGRIADDEMERYSKAKDIVRKMPLYVNDVYTPVDILVMETERKVESEGAKLVIFDYLQLIPSNQPFRSEQQHVDYVFGKLLGFAKKYKGVATIVISQLKRREEGEPVNADLYHSGKIEQGAHTIMFIWNPNPSGWPRPEGGISGNKLVDCRVIKIAKQKDGPQRKCILGWDENTTTFYNANEFDFRAYQQAVKGTPKIQKKKY